MTDQPDMFGGASVGLREVLQANAQQFRDDFPAWLEENGHIWRAFCGEADKVRALGRQHYSARTIIHYLRHETVLADSGVEWKINNNASPDMSRLYMLMRDAGGFFETRVQVDSERAA